MELGGTCSREETIELFGELDVWRAERRGLDYYVAQMATPKLHYLSFTKAVLHCYSHWQTTPDDALQQWFSTLPALLRGALIWWLRTPHFMQRVLSYQRCGGCWPFEREPLPSNQNRHSPGSSGS